MVRENLRTEFIVLTDLILFQETVKMGETFIIFHTYTIHQQTRSKIDIQYQSKPAAKYWGSTRKQTFFFSRNGECKHVNRKPIIVCANKAIKKKFC